MIPLIPDFMDDFMDDFMGDLHHRPVMQVTPCYGSKKNHKMGTRKIIYSTSFILYLKYFITLYYIQTTKRKM